MCCVKGKHRTVAMAILLYLILQASCLNMVQAQVLKPLYLMFNE